MQNNTTLSNMTEPYIKCNIGYVTLVTIQLYSSIVPSICSFIGNLLVILTVYKNNNLRNSSNYFIVSMSVSDILFPFFALLRYKFLLGRSSPQSNIVGNLLCKFLPFTTAVSYGVSTLTLVAIAVYRFFAVMFPLQARVQNKRRDFIVLLLTWVIPIAVLSPQVVYKEFREQNQKCFNEMERKQHRIWLFACFVLFFFVPQLIMLVLYPLITIKLKQQKLPGNANNIQEVIRKRQNFRLTMMFIVITVAFLLCWGPSMIYWMLYIIGIDIVDICVSLYFNFVSSFTPLFFHAINPVTYFVFLSSFRQGVKNLFRPQVPAGNSSARHTSQGSYSN